MSGLISIREVERPTRFLSHSPAPSTASSHAQSGRLLFPPPQLLPLPSPKAPDTSDSGLRSLPRVETQSGCFPWGSIPACLLTECGRGSGMPCRVGGVALGSGHLGHVAGAARRPQSWQGSTPRHRALVRPPGSALRVWPWAGLQRGLCGWRCVQGTEPTWARRVPEE